ncbi:MAG: hypothetical protein MI757_03025 [Pirellulales bacterium]|nr:hypothetical protein [Pirellulales bacterium]
MQVVEKGRTKSPKQVVVYCPYVLWRWHFATALEVIEDHLDAGDNVTVLACQGQMNACDMNPDRSEAKCMRCRRRRMAGLDLLSQPVNVVPFEQLSLEDTKELNAIRTEFENIEELKRYKIDDFDIGMAALSSLVSLRRDPDVDLVKERDLLTRLLRTAWMSWRSFQNYLESYEVDLVYLFNGRFAPVRGVLRVCQKAGVECLTHDRGNDQQHYALYPNTLPHDQRLFQDRIREAWESADDPTEREEIAKIWFHQRATGVAQSWVSFVAEQEAEQLPNDWDSTKKNIVFFSSSEDEFVSISDRWSHPLFPSQVEAMKAILASIESDPENNSHVYLRMHPNLGATDNRQKRQLAALRSPHLTVIEPEAKTSTYAMMRHADQAITVGSTAGLEAVYWGTPSILIGPAFYQDLGATYNPATSDELMDLLRVDLPPRDIEPALMYGYFLATFGTPYKHFESDGFLDGRFHGNLLSKTSVSRWKVWLLDRPARLRKALAKLARRSRDTRQESGRRSPRSDRRAA